MMTKRHQFLQLRSSAPHVLPSLLMCDFGNLEREVRRLEAAGVAALHLDVMDGNFVPNLTYGMPIVAALRRLTPLPLDVHLMIEGPARYVGAFCDAGADAITFHVEAGGDIAQTLRSIREREVAAGLACNPDTPLEAVTPFVDLCDLILVMSVNAGFGGQAFRREALDKLHRLRSLAGEHCLLEVDGGVNQTTIRDGAHAGADLLVVGSAIFRHQDYSAAVQRLTALAHGD